MRNYTKILFFGFLGIYLTGCTSLMTIEEAAPRISIKQASEPLVIAVLDQRPYVLNKKKTTSFEGLIRSNFGIPYSYSTPTHEPLSIYLGKRVEHGFKVNGITATLYPTSLETTKETLLKKLAQDGEKSLIISLSEWKYDHHTFVKSSTYDADIIVIDKQGNSLVQKKFTGKDDIPSGAIANAMQQVYKARFEHIFDDAEIRQALER